MAHRSAKNDTQAHLQKMQRAEDGKKAMAEYEAAGAAMRARTEKLRALRLAKEAADAANAPKTKSATKKAGKKSKAKAVPLSDWLKDREGSGRNS